MFIYMFLKWALGINRKASNIGTWGETGRYPIAFEGINLTLKYIARLKSLNGSSLVSLAFKEQQNLQLAWYSGIEPVLRLDPCYSTDQATLFKAQLHRHASNIPQKENFLIHNGFAKKLPAQTLKPLISKHFSAYTIMKRIKTIFKESWTQHKTSSPKLCFYNSVKQVFSKELYLDRVNNYYDRANITRLRISAHRLEIELGRRKNIERSMRHCKWCKINTGINVTECEDHFLYNCKLTSVQRSKGVNSCTVASSVRVHFDPV
jgi:hypothetical protein